MFKDRIHLCTASCVAALLAATPGLAQAADQAAAPAPTPATDSATPGLADIVVTANRRSERLQDVPISVTAVTKDVLERQNVRDISDLTKLVPGLTINYGSQPGNFSINMRGIGTLSNGIAVESDVAVVIDDVPVGFQAAAFKDLIDVERIEALKGPQSTLFGKSAIAGVLNVTTQAPTSTWTGRATGLVTNDREWRLGGTISGPISDTLKMRLTVARDSYAGNVRNITNGSWLNGSKGLTVTGKLQWDPSERITVSFQPRFNQTDATCCVSPINSLSPGLFYQGIPQLPASSVLAGIPVNDPANTKVRNDFRSGGDSSTYGATLRASYTLGDGQLLPGASLTYIGSFDRYQMHDYQDIDGTDAPFLLYFPVAAPSGINGGARILGHFHARSVTQELRLTSPAGQHLRYTFGLWYARNSLDRLLDRGPVLQYIRYLATSHNENYSFYTDLSYDLTRKITLNGGFRLNRQHVDYTFDNYTAAVPFHLGGGSLDDAITGKVGAQYHLTRDNMLYATFSTGYKGQAYDLVSTFNAAEAAAGPVRPETAKNYEIGFKSSLFDHRLLFNTTLFWTDYHGFQTSVQSFLPDGTYLTFLNSIGKLRTRGVEVDLMARPTNRLKINASGAFDDAKIIDFPYGPCYGGQTAAQGCVPDPRVSVNPSNIQNLDGKRLNNAPKYKFNLGSEYDFPLGKPDLGGFITFAYRWQSQINFSLNQDPVTVEKPYGVFDASIGGTAGGGRYKLTVFVNNLFDKHYAVGLGNTTSGFSAPGVVASGTNWQPARDSFRYVGVRLDMGF
ncbi:TonB-dependent receptor [Novosphingobium terrae]|uniref:TonB-dependent receptor n=1 Tax=Novosphingobium terrae TaxID=2726189 RepID=UPI00197CF877|nr:TonB-dependent receptor [Novosphingobium terrae]